MSTTFMQQLIRGLLAEPLVLAAFLGGDLAGGSTQLLEQVDLYLVAEPTFGHGLAPWLGRLGEVAHSGPDAQGWTVITTDGVEWRLHLLGPGDPVPERGLEPLFDRRGQVPAAGVSTEVDLGQLSGSFWRDLYRAARALERGQSFTAHRWLTACGQQLINLYQLALAPDATLEGWEGADAHPQMARALRSLQEVLVAPLEPRAQWQTAHRLAVAYEGLMLPLCQRLGVEYPMPLRSMAFQRLDRARPAQQGTDPAGLATGGQSQPNPSKPDQAQPGGPVPGRLRVAKGRLRRG